MITPIQIIKKDVWGINYFTFVWAIDETNADDVFKKIFDQFIWNNLIFDFWLLTYGNSRFLGYLSKMYEYVSEKKWKMVIVNCVEPIRDILDICWILSLIDSVKTQDEALELIWAK